MADSEETFEVEQIFGRRKNRKGQIEYLIRWQGYDSDWDTWEPLCNLGEALDIVEEFNERLILGQVSRANMKVRRKVTEQPKVAAVETPETPEDSITSILMNGLPELEELHSLRKGADRSGRPGSRKATPTKLQDGRVASRTESEELQTLRKGPERPGRPGSLKGTPTKTQDSGAATKTVKSSKNSPIVKDTVGQCVLKDTSQLPSLGSLNRSGTSKEVGKVSPMRTNTSRSPVKAAMVDGNKKSQSRSPVKSAPISGVAIDQAAPKRMGRPKSAAKLHIAQDTKKTSKLPNKTCIKEKPKSSPNSKTKSTRNTDSDTNSSPVKSKASEIKQGQMGGLKRANSGGKLSKESDNGKEPETKVSSSEVISKNDSGESRSNPPDDSPGRKKKQRKKVGVKGRGQKTIVKKNAIAPSKNTKKSQADARKAKVEVVKKIKAALRKGKSNQRVTRSLVQRKSGKGLPSGTKIDKLSQKKKDLKAEKDSVVTQECHTPGSDKNDPENSSEHLDISTVSVKKVDKTSSNINNGNKAAVSQGVKKTKSSKDSKMDTLKGCKKVKGKSGGEEGKPKVGKQTLKVSPTCDSEAAEGTAGEYRGSSAASPKHHLTSSSTGSPNKRSLKDLLTLPLHNASSAGVKPNYKAVRKTVKRQISSDSSTDSEMLYSLAETNGDLVSKRPKFETKDSTPDLEVTFKGACSPSPGKKLLLKNSMKAKPKTTIVHPVPRSPVLAAPMAGTPPRPQSPVYYAETTPYKTPPSSPSSIIAHSHGEPSCAKADHFLSDLPAIPVIPILPSSPSAASYKKLLNNVTTNKVGTGRGSKRKALEEDEASVERRMSVRQSESVFRYKEIVVKKCPGFTQMWLFTQTKTKNALNPKVLQELCQALHNAKFDDSRLVMLSGSGSVFCSGVDLNYLLSEDRRQAAHNMAEAVREFINVLIAFPKPIIAAVNGPAIGLGVSILPLCDIIYASDKASFYCPYARLSQTPEGCASFTFPTVMGLAMANELLLGGRKITAIEAYQIGLVSQVFWPTSMMQEVIPRLQNMASYSAKALESSKLLIRSPQRTKLEFTAESECAMLQERWATVECHRMIRLYLDDEQDILV